MSNNNAYHRESLASISQRRLSTVKSKSIYVLPNAFTAAALFSAFYGIIAAMNGDFYAAAIAVFFSMLFDGMDGRVARLTHTQSEFGVQMDSLADAVSFGVAPGLIVYEYTLKGLGKLGWAIAFIYCLCAILRLAQFLKTFSYPGSLSSGNDTNRISLLRTVHHGITIFSTGCTNQVSFRSDIHLMT